MNQKCQVKFDDKKHQVTVTFNVNSVRQNMVLDYEKIRKGLDPSFVRSRVHRLSYDEFKYVSSELAKRFRVDPKISLSWAQQYALVFGKVADVMHPVNQSMVISAEQLHALKVDVKMLQNELCKKAGITPKEFSEALSVGYCGGVDNLFCTDDFLTIRQGNKIVSIVNLPGNDYIELKEYFTNRSRQILSEDNIMALRESIRQMKLDSALELAQRSGTLKMSPGLQLGMEK